MKTLTIAQPWASLIAHGVKTIETRPRATNVRGRIAIHAGAKRPPSFWWDCSTTDFLERWTPVPLDLLDSLYDESEDANGSEYWYYRWSGPLGAIVATADLYDCVPIVAILPAQDRAPRTPPYPSYDHLAVYPVHAAHQAVVIHDGIGKHVDDQLPYGDFRPGRWACLLRDAKPTTERCPACWGTCLQPSGIFSCDTCRGIGRCDPIPAKGRPDWWEWTP